MTLWVDGKRSSRGVHNDAGLLQKVSSGQCNPGRKRFLCHSNSRYHFLLLKAPLLDGRLRAFISHNKVYKIAVLTGGLACIHNLRIIACKEYNYNYHYELLFIFIYSTNQEWGEVHGVFVQWEIHYISRIIEANMCACLSGVAKGKWQSSECGI